MRFKAGLAVAAIVAALVLGWATRPQVQSPGAVARGPTPPAARPPSGSAPVPTSPPATDAAPSRDRRPTPDEVAPSATARVPATSEAVAPTREASETVTDAVRRVVEQHEGQLVFCWEAARRDWPDASGDLDIHLVVEAGTVEVEVEDYTDADQTFTDCVAKKVARWDFSTVPDGEVTWPVRFR